MLKTSEKKKKTKNPKILLDIPCLGYQLNIGFIMCSAIQASTIIRAGYDPCLSELCISAKILNKQNKNKQITPTPSAFLLVSFPHYKRNLVLHYILQELVHFVACWKFCLQQIPLCKFKCNLV